MSHQSHHTSSKEENRAPDDRRLPPIRDLFKALEESRQMSPGPSQNYVRNPKTQQTMNLPPLTNHGHIETAYHDSSRARSSSLSAAQSGYPGQGSSSSRERITSVAASGPSKLSSSYTAWDDFDPEKRYKCDYCGKRFDRPSSLQVHIRTHTGVQPYTCEWPGCARTFNVKSNMLRHWRSHERSDPSLNGQDGQESSGSGPSFSHPPTRGTGYYS